MFRKSYNSLFADEPKVKSIQFAVKTSFFANFASLREKKSCLTQSRKARQELQRLGLASKVN
jgi:hypothetical protein